MKRYKVPNWDHDKKSKYLEETGWERSWSDDNWVRSTAKNREANTGITTDAAFYIQYGMDNNLRFKIKYND